MQDRIDPLIAERAPWLFSSAPWAVPCRFTLTRMLGYSHTVRLAEHFEAMATPDIMRIMGDLLAKDLDVTGLENIPTHGPALIVANHPTGIADGIMLNTVLKRVRPDAYFYANSDILRVLPQMDDFIAPVEWRLDKRSHSKNRETMAFTRKAVEQGRVGVIFPSGRLAKRRGLKLYERPWMASAAMIARKFELPVIPINIRARNSVMFYLFDLLHPTLRDITLFHETLNKHRQPYRVTVGQPISPYSLPLKSEEGIEVLRKATLALGGKYAPSVSLVQNSRWVRKVGVSL